MDLCTNKFRDHFIPPFNKARISTIVNGLNSTWQLYPSTLLANLRLHLEQNARNHGHIQVDESVFLLLANGDDGTLEPIDGNATIGNVITSMGTDKQLVSMVANSTHPPASADSIQPVKIEFLNPAGVAPEDACPGPSNIKKTPKSQFLTSKLPESRPFTTKAGEENPPRNPKTRAVREEAAFSLAKSQHRKVANVNGERVVNVQAQPIPNVQLHRTANVQFQPHAHRNASQAATSIDGGVVSKRPGGQVDSVVLKRNRRKRRTPSSGRRQASSEERRPVPQRVRRSDWGALHQLEARQYYAKPAAVRRVRGQHHRRPVANVKTKLVANANVEIAEEGVCVRGQPHRETANVDQQPVTANVKTKFVASANVQIAEGGVRDPVMVQENQAESDPASLSSNSSASEAPGVVPKHRLGQAHSVRLHRRQKDRHFSIGLPPGRGPKRVTLSDLTKLHELTATEAALKLDIGQSQLQVVSRKLGLERWPSKKVRSLLGERAFVRSTGHQQAKCKLPKLIVPLEDSDSSESDSEADILRGAEQRGPNMSHSCRLWNRLHNGNAWRRSGPA